ncbi:FIG038982: hypothetical protein [Devosia sp. DBB001]|nr:FIG038982: hypothetical protein [Devosia sp. DBB001]
MSAMAKSIITRFHILLLGVIIAITGTAAYKVPVDEGLAMHWDAHGQPDWIWPPEIAFAVVPVIAVVVAMAFGFGALLVPKNRLEMARHVVEPALSAVLALGVCIQFGLLMIANGSDFDIIRILAFAVAAGLLLLGILLREAERHTYAGLRLPWAMPDDGVWRRTHMIAGWAYVVAAIALGTLAWLQPFPSTLIIAFPLALAVPVLLARLASLTARSAS